MKRFAAYILVAVLAFAAGTTYAIYYQLKSELISPFNCSWSKRVAGKKGYDIYNTKTNFGDELDFYHEFTSPEATHYLIQSNAKAAELIEQNSKMNKNGQKIGERAITFFSNDGKYGTVRISWTDGDEFWFVQSAPLDKTAALELVQKVETKCFAR